MNSVSGPLSCDMPLCIESVRLKQVAVIAQPVRTVFHEHAHALPALQMWASMLRLSTYLWLTRMPDSLHSGDAACCSTSGDRGHMPATERRSPGMNDDERPMPGMMLGEVGAPTDASWVSKLKRCGAWCRGNSSPAVDMLASICCCCCSC